jgi:hypothetical protein
VPGVLNSQIGHLSGSEVVEVTYDTSLTTLKGLVAALKEESSFYNVIVRDKREFSEIGSQVKPSEIKEISETPHFIESKYSLRSQHPDLYYLDLTEQQAIALNSWSYFGGKMPDVLTGTQKERRRQLESKLRHKKPDALHPARSGPGLEEYRRQLLDWIEN